jgi:glycosyltransferase involved in cell wall biosynthesis
MYELERRLVRAPRLIITNSRAGRAAALQRGLPDAKVAVIPNGIDTARFAPAPGDGERLRREWGVDPDQVLVGVVGHLHPAKGHVTLLDAAGLLDRPGIRFVVVGAGPPDHRSRLLSRADQLGLSSTVIWAGERDDMPAVYSSLDLLCLPSDTEGFPNVVGEAMACEVPCVVTDVGDAATIVGDLGTVVEPGDARALAAALASALDRRSGEEAAGWRASLRRRIEERFSVDIMVDATEQALRGALRLSS